MANATAEILGLLSDPLRWQLVGELGRSDRRVGELVRLVGKPQNLVSYHLAELRRSGIVSACRSSADGRDVYYRADLFAARPFSATPGSRSIPGSRSRRRHLAMSNRDGLDRDCCSCAPATTPFQIAEALVEHRVAGQRRGTQRRQPQPLHPGTGAGHG